MTRAIPEAVVNRAFSTLFGKVFDYPMDAQTKSKVIAQFRRAKRTLDDGLMEIENPHPQQTNAVGAPSESLMQQA